MQQRQENEFKSDMKESIETLRQFHADEALALIVEELALVKVIESKAGDNSHWIFILEQLCHPNLYRPVHKLVAAKDKKINRESVYDASLEIWNKREVLERGRYKNTDYIKKTATTLLPQDGQIQLFNSNGVNIGILVDLNRCQLPMSSSGHPKYAYKTNAGTNSRSWIEGCDGNLVKSVPLDEIKENNRKIRASGKTPTHNEIMAKMHRQALRAIIIPKNLITDRLNGLHKKFLVQHWLNIDLPLLFITKDAPVSEYKKEDWIKDILDGLKRDKTSPSFWFCVSILKSICLYELVLWNEIISQTNKLDMSAAGPILFFSTLKNPYCMEEAKELLKLNEYNVEKDSLLDWLCVKNADLAEWYAKYILGTDKINEQEDSKQNSKVDLKKTPENTKLLSDSVKNHHFKAVMALVTFGEEGSFVNHVIAEAFLLCNLMGNKDICSTISENYNLRLDRRLYQTTLSGKPLLNFLYEKDVVNLSDEELDDSIYYFAYDKNIEMVDKILSIRKTIPTTIWWHTDTQNNSALQLLTDIKEYPQESCVINTIITLCERLPRIIHLENKEQETLLSLSVKICFHDGLFLSLLNIINQHNLINKFKPENLQRTLYYLIKNKYYESANQLLDFKLDTSTPLYTDPSDNNAIIQLLNEEKPPLELIMRLSLFKDFLKDVGGVSPILLMAQKDYLNLFSHFIKNKEPNLLTGEQIHRCLLQLIILKLENYAYILSTHFNDYNTDLTIENETGNTALHHAIKNNIKYMEIIDWLCKFKNHSVNNKTNMSPLHLAALENDKVFHRMLDHKETVNAYSSTQLEDIVLVLIQKKKHKSAIKLLDRTDRMKDALIADKESLNTALHYSVMDDKPNIEMIKKLRLNKKALRHENKEGLVPLLIAAKNNNTDVVSLLTEPECISVLNDKQLGRVLLQLVQHKQFSIVAKLIEARPRAGVISCIYYWNEETGNNLLHFLVQDSSFPMNTLKHLLIPATIIRENKSGATPLSIAADLNNRMIIEDAFSVNLFDSFTIKSGTPVAYYLLYHFNFDLVKKLINLKKCHFENEDGETISSLILKILASANIHSESKSISDNNHFDLELFKHLCVCKNISLSKTNESKSDALSLSLARGQYGIAEYIISHFNHQFSVEQMTKNCLEIVKFKLPVPIHIFDMLLDKNADRLEVATIQKCVTYLAEKLSKEEKSDDHHNKKFQFINLEFLINLSGENKDLIRKKAIIILDTIVNHTHSPNCIIKFVKDLYSIKASLKYFQSSLSSIFKSDPVVDIVNKCKARVIQMMQSNPELLSDKYAVNFIYLEVGDHKKYISKFKEMMAKTYHVDRDNVNSIN